MFYAYVMQSQYSSYIICNAVKEGFSMPCCLSLPTTPTHHLPADSHLKCGIRMVYTVANHSQAHGKHTSTGVLHTYELLAVYNDGRVCISILHSPGDDPHGYEKASERWSPVQSVRLIPFPA